MTVVAKWQNYWPINLRCGGELKMHTRPDRDVYDVDKFDSNCKACLGVGDPRLVNVPCMGNFWNDPVGNIVRDQRIGIGGVPSMQSEDQLVYKSANAPEAFTLEGLDISGSILPSPTTYCQAVNAYLQNLFDGSTDFTLDQLGLGTQEWRYRKEDTVGGQPFVVRISFRPCSRISFLSVNALQYLGELEISVGTGLGAGFLAYYYLHQIGMPQHDVLQTQTLYLSPSQFTAFGGTVGFCYTSTHPNTFPATLTLNSSA